MQKVLGKNPISTESSDTSWTGIGASVVWLLGEHVKQQKVSKKNPLAPDELTGVGWSVRVMTQAKEDVGREGPMAMG